MSCTARPSSRLSRGFTLIEVMITVAIVAILASIALPAYTNYLRRGDLTEAFTTLSTYRVTMEQYYQDNRTYGATSCAGGAMPPSSTGTQYFTMRCSVTGSGTGYTLTATGNGARTTGYDYTVDEANTKNTTLFAGVTSTKTCWLIKGNEC